jgi:sulfite reductase alpha subunit-like flavoprotein
VAVVEYKTRLHETRKGTCSFWLSTLKPEANTRVPVWIKKGSFAVDYTAPMICIGPGTGVAPFRSILYEKIRCDRDRNESSESPCQNHLFFGCRSRAKDYYFEQEWAGVQSSLCVHAAFSRDQPDKIYVQDLMLEQAGVIFDLVYNKRGCVFIAGNAKRMPQDVMAVLEKIVADGLAKVREATSTTTITDMAKEFIKSMELSKRIQMETWS